MKNEKKNKKSSQPCPVWLCGVGIILQSKGLLVRFLVTAHAWLAGVVPHLHIGEANDRCFSLTLRFLSLSSSLPLSPSL